MTMLAKYQQLIQHRASLEDSLEDADLIKLSKELLKRQIINKEFHDRFSSLDPDPDHLESDIKVRYLLQQVCERVREDGEVFDRLVRVLTRLGGEEVRVQCEAMKKELRQIEGKEAASGADTGGESDLVEQDVPNLVQILASGSHLWDTIGIALNIPKHKRVDCGTGEEKSVSKLSNILTTWILGSYEGARPATLSGLKEALASETVGLGKLAQYLSKFELNIEEESILQQRNVPIKPSIVFQTYNTEVSENKSSLLEVQVDCNGSESYQWSKDGEPLLDGADFSGVCSNILYINRASQCTEGKYSCCVSRGSETIHSAEMNVSVIYPIEKKQLFKFYSLIENEIPQDSWPPVGNSKYINLVIIKQQLMNICDYYTIRGDMDDILENKEVTKYEEAFREYREGALILVEGRPGSGKTTLVHKLTRDWAMGKKVLQGAKMVFLVTLRLINATGKDKSLLDLLEIFYGGVYSTIIEHDLQKNRGKGACFILDGLDEYPIESKKNLIIDQLLFTRILPHSMIIVASRPIAIQELKKTCKMRIEVVGFSRDQIYSYVSSYPFGNCPGSMACDMAKFLDQHPNVRHMCYLPVHAAMICYLFSQLEGNIPHRETQIYEQFTIATLLRYKVSKGEKIQIKSLKDLYGEEKALFDSICKLAFDMIFNYQQVISKSDAQVSLSNDSVFGLLTVESTSKLHGIDDFYAFHHLTFQEFLAAFHVLEAQLEVSNLVKKLVLHNVLKFYCGLGGSSNTQSCKTILQMHHNDDLLYKAHCAYESQQVELCDHVIIDKVFGLITSADFIALAYVISNVSKVVEKLSFQKCWLDSEGVQTLYSFADKKRLQKIKHLTVHLDIGFQKEIIDNEIGTLNCFLKHLPVFEELDLIDATIRISSIEHLTREVQLPHLTTLKITVYNEFCSYPEEIVKLLTFGSQNIRKIYFSVKKTYFIVYDVIWRKIFHYALSCPKVQKPDVLWIYLYNSDKFSSFSHARLSRCTEVVLVNCCIGNEEAEILASTLNTSVLKNLVLDFNRVGDSGAVALAGCLAKCSVVNEVSIQCNCIGDSGATALASALVHCSCLRKLDLQGNSLGDNGALAIAKAIKNLSGLDLYLHNIKITEDGIERVLVQRPSTKIRSMTFTSEYIVNQNDTDTLRRALSCGNVPQLNLSVSNIYSLEKLILDGLKSVRALEFTLNDKTVPNLCSIIDNLSTLNYVRCYKHDIISTDALQRLCTSLENNKSINKFDICNSKDATIVKIVSKRTNLHTLHLSGCRIKPIIIESFFNSAFSLHTLVLNNCNISPMEALYLSIKGLAHCKSLRCLHLSMNYIGDDGAIAVANALMHHTSLLELGVECNGITLRGMCALAHVIKDNHLQCIIFAGNNIPLGAAVLFKTTCVHTLQYLDLRKTGFGVNINDIAILTIGLMMYKQLTKLYLGENNIGSSGLIILAKGLQCCTNLRTLSLDSNGIKADGVAAMLPVMKYCKYLKCLDFSKNKIGVDSAVVLVGGWHHESPLSLNLRECFDGSHESALLNVKRCCDKCDRLLELYYNNGYIDIEINNRSIPKLVIP